MLHRPIETTPFLGRNPAQTAENLHVTCLEESRRHTSAYAAEPLPSTVFGSVPCMDEQRNSNYKR